MQPCKNRVDDLVLRRLWIWALSTPNKIIGFMWLYGINLLVPPSCCCWTPLMRADHCLHEEKPNLRKRFNCLDASAHLKKGSMKKFVSFLHNIYCILINTFHSISVAKKLDNKYSQNPLNKYTCLLKEIHNFLKWSRQLSCYQFTFNLD